MNVFSSRILQFFLIILLFLSTVPTFALPGPPPIVYPVGAPAGQTIGGTYRSYFDNIFMGCSTPGDAISGFNPSGLPICITPSVTGLNLAGATGYTLYHNGTTWVSSPNIYNTNGNVGIGTSTPWAKLEVNGQIKITGGTPWGGKILTSDASGLASWTSLSSSFSWAYWSFSGDIVNAAAFLWTTNAQDLVFKANNDEWFRITAFGNIRWINAAGNLAGSYNLALWYDAGRDADGSYNTAIGWYSPWYQMSWIYNTAIGWSYAGYSMSGLSNIALWTYAGSNMTTGNNNLYLGSYAVGVPGRDDQFSIWNVLYGFWMGSNGLPNGRVWIGTMNPSFKLEVVGSGSFSTLRLTQWAASGKVLVSDTTGNAYWSDGIVASTTPVGNIIWWVQNYVPKFWSGGNGLVTGLLYDNGQTLGVGTNTPSPWYVLHALWSILIGDDHVYPAILNEGFESAVPPAWWTTNTPGGITIIQDSANVFSGSDSVRFNGNGSNSSFASIDKMITITENSFLSFYWKVSSEPGGDVLAFCLDANPCTINTSWEKDWEKVTYNLSPWIHTLSWKYSKDQSLANGLDSAWIDQILIERYGPTYLVWGHIGVGIPVPKYPLDVEWYIQSHGYCIGWTCANTWRGIVEQGTTSWNYNLYVGSSSLGMTTTWAFNSAFWPFALAQNRTGKSNVAIGTTSLTYNTSGDNNTAIWFTSLYKNVTGSNNTALGYWTLINALTASNNIAIGYKAGEAITTGSNNILIGHDIDTPTPTSNYTLNIGNIIFWTGISGLWNAISPWNIGIGTSNPAARLTVSWGTIQIINGSQWVGKVLMSDSEGIGTWQSFSISTSSLTGGTDSYIPKFSSQSGIVNSRLFENGSRIGINTTSPQFTLDVQGGSGYINAGSWLCIGGSCISTWSGAVQITGNSNYLAKYDSVGNIASSQVYETGGRILLGDVNTLLTGSVTRGYLTIMSPSTTSTTQPLITLSETGWQECRMWINWSNKIGSNCSWNTSGSSSYLPNQLIRANASGSDLTGATAFQVGTQFSFGNSTPGSLFEVWSWSTVYMHMKWVNNLGLWAGSVRYLLTGNADTGFGHESLYTLTTGYSNSAFGHQALRMLTTGYNNSAFWKESLYNNNDGTWNSAFGYQALRTGTSPDYTVAVGGQSLYSATTSQRNTAVGYRSLYGATTGNNNVALGSDAGSGVTTGSNNILIGDSVQVATWSLSDQLNIWNWIYGSGGNIGVWTSSPTAKFEIDSGLSDISWLKFSQLNSSSPLTSNGIVAIGVNGSGDVVAVSPISNIAVYVGVDRNTALVPNPDLNSFQITYDYNRYFAIPGRQSFVVSNGSTASYNGPYFKENGTSSLCSDGNSPYDCSSPDPVTGISASPYNSFTMSAKGDTFGYQIALWARWDAPLYARSGKFWASQTGWLFLNDGTSTPSPWQKVLSIPANHPEYFYINTGFNSQLRTQTWWWNIGIGTTFPYSRFEVWTGSSTDPLLHFRGVNNVALGLKAIDITATGTIIGSGNTALWTEAMSVLTTGFANVAVGYQSLRNITSWQRNIALGYQSLGNSTTGNDNIAVGYQAANATAGTPISNSIALGYQSLAATTASNLIAIWYQSLNANIGWVQNQAIGYQSLLSNTLGSSNIAEGYLSLNQNTTGSGNIAIGVSTLGWNTVGSFSTAIGYRSLVLSTATWGNTALGANTLPLNTIGAENTAIGLSALSTNISGSWNVAVGYTSLASSRIVNFSTAVGYQSARYMASGSNTSLGAFSLYGGNSIVPTLNRWFNNTALWAYALRGTTGVSSLWTNNVAVGYSSLLSLTSGYSNVVLGSYAGSGITTGYNNILIGDSVQPLSDTGGNQLNIGNWIYGTWGNIGIGVSNPTATLEVNGQVRISGGGPWAGKILMSDATGLATWQNPSGGMTIPWAITGNSGTTVNSNFIGNTDAVDLGLRTNNVERMRLMANGWIAMWATSAGTYWLFLSGTSYFSNTVNIGTGRFLNFYNQTLGGTGGLQWTLPNDQASLYASEVSAWQTDYVFKLGTNITTDRFVWWLKGASDVYPMILSANYGNFYAGNMYIDSTNSRIGFGTVAPIAGAKVDINWQIRIAGGNPGNGKVLVSDASGIGSWQSLSAASGSFADWWILGNSWTLASTNFLWTTDAIDLVIRTNNTERLRINALDGNLSINGITLGRGSWSISSNTVFGFWAFRSNTTGANTVAIGYQALRSSNSSFNTALGYDAGYNVTSGTNNIAIGYNTPLASTTASNQLNIGNWIYGSNGNIGIWTNTPGQLLTVAGWTIQILNGSQWSGKVLMSDTTGIASWQAAPPSATEWSKIGNTWTLASTNFLWTTDAIDLVIRTNNTERLRINALDGNLSINGITIGRGSGSISSNTTFGFWALRSNVTGANTVAIGYQALRSSNSSFNTALGYDAGYNVTSGTNNIAIGYNTPLESATASNQLNIGNWIYGVNGNIGIGTNTPGQLLTVSGWSLQIIDWSQWSWRVLVSDANGVATWKTPSSWRVSAYIYRMTVSQSVAISTASTVNDLTSTDIPVWPYQFEVIGKFRSNAASNGIGITLGQISWASTEFIGMVSTQLTPSTQYQWSFSNPWSLVVSSAVPAANTDYGFTMKWTMNITSTGAVAVQISSELNGSQVTLQPGTVMIIRSLDPSLAGWGI